MKSNKKRILKGLEGAVEQVNLHKSRKLKLKTIQEVLNEQQELVLGRQKEARKNSSKMLDWDQVSKGLLSKIFAFFL